MKLIVFLLYFALHDTVIQSYSSNPANCAIATALDLSNHNFESLENILIGNIELLK